ncbi:DUF4055 domain-containing protein [Sphingobium sp. H39-3-25]|uniref:DUF4055 domain-containing protein n=1 Tax=Sphingobium arseniciresistens TaxID=3030834 RepID=UPI0023B995C8|nr:DUF4055 domain-containing protein [Sphingobium arseniciresistens]
MTSDISTPTPEISCHFKRWKRNRDVLAGEDAVKAAGQSYLPKLPSQSSADYLAYNASVDFFPAAQRVHESRLGLIFRKDPVAIGGEGYEDVLATISRRYSLDELARELASETLVTNFTGVLVDSPAQPSGLSAAQAIADGYRPFVELYRAESILEVTREVIRNRFALTRVRLLDDAVTVRELILIDGVYQVIMHRKIGSDWVEDAPIIPTKGGQPLGEIPFKVVSTVAGAISPPKAPIDDLALMNLAHFRAQAQHSNVLRHIASPIRNITGIATDGGEAPFVVSPDSVWLFESEATKVNISEHSGAGVAALKEHCDSLIDQMAAIGDRVLQTEKAAAEAAETLAIRRAAEGSILAAMAKTVATQLETMVNLAMDWMRAAPISYSLNTDFMPIAMTAQDITALLAVVQAGRMSSETFFSILKAGEVVDDGLDYETEKARIDQDTVDAPPTGI